MDAKESLANKDDASTELCFWQEIFLDGAAARKAFYQPLKYLRSMRISEAACESTCERGYIASGLIVDWRPGLSSIKASQLTHLYWGSHSFIAAPSNQNLHLQRKRKRLGDDPVEEALSDENTSKDAAVRATVEDALDMAVAGKG